MLRQVSGNSVTIAPLKCSNTPRKEIDSIIQKYIGSDRSSQYTSITTMFHSTLTEEKQLLVSPYKKLTEEDCNKYFQTFERASSDYQDEFHHLQTSSDFSSHDSLHEIAQKLEFDSPRATHYTYGEKSPEFYNPENKLKGLPKELPVIEENDEIQEQRLSGLITQIDQKIGQQQQIKEVCQIKEEQFLDFPAEPIVSEKSIQVKILRNVPKIQPKEKYPILSVIQARLLVGTIVIILLCVLLSKL